MITPIKISKVQKRTKKNHGENSDKRIVKHSTLIDKKIFFVKCAMSIEYYQCKLIKMTKLIEPISKKQIGKNLIFHYFGTCLVKINFT